MALQLQNFTTLVQNTAAAVQGSASKLIDLTVGSVTRAILEANASVALWLQYMLVLLLQRQRLATSAGADVDSWTLDYGLLRLPGIAATGSVTLSRFSTASAATIAPGITVRTGDGTQTFTVVTDTTNALWNVMAGAYIVPVAIASITVPIVAQTLGLAGNVVVGAISLLSSAAAGIDTVNNASALTNGIAAESDAALKARFPLYIGGLSKATGVAIGAAIASVQQGLTYGLAVNVDAFGAFKPGNFVVTVDDGSGTPSTALKALVYTAVDGVRAFAETFSVQSPTVVTAAVSLTLTAGAGYIKANMQGPLAFAIAAYINSLPIGASLYFTRLAQVVYDAVPGVASITALLINGAAADITATPSTVIKSGVVSVN